MNLDVPDAKMESCERDLKIQLTENSIRIFQGMDRELVLQVVTAYMGQSENAVQSDDKKLVLDD